MADYLKIARTALKGAPKSAGAGAESATSVESPEMEARSEPAEISPISTLEEREHANTIRRRAGVRLMALEGGVTIGIWSDLDSAELREALRVFHPDGVPPILYLDGSGIPDKYKERRVAGEPPPLDVLHAMEQDPAEPWETRDLMLSEMDWSPDGIPSAEWKAALNRLFLEQGVTGKRGRIKAATVRHGEQAAPLTEESEVPDGE